MADFAPWQEVDYRLISGNPLPSYASITLKKNIIAIYVNSPTAKPTWRFAGLLNQIISLQIPPLHGKANIEAKKLRLRETQLIEFDPNLKNYQIEITFPRWLDTMEIALWQSERSINDTEIDLKKINTELDILLEKIENIDV